MSDGEGFTDRPTPAPPNHEDAANLVSDLASRRIVELAGFHAQLRLNSDDPEVVATGNYPVSTAFRAALMAGFLWEDDDDGNLPGGEIVQALRPEGLKLPEPGFDLNRKVSAARSQHFPMFAETVRGNERNRSRRPLTVQLFHTSHM